MIRLIYKLIFISTKTLLLVGCGISFASQYRYRKIVPKSTRKSYVQQRRFQPMVRARQKNVMQPVRRQQQTQRTPISSPHKRRMPARSQLQRVPSRPSSPVRPVAARAQRSGGVPPTSIQTVSQIPLPPTPPSIQTLDRAPLTQQQLATLAVANVYRTRQEAVKKDVMQQKKERIKRLPETLSLETAISFSQRELAAMGLQGQIRLQNYIIDQLTIKAYEDDNEDRLNRNDVAQIINAAIDNYYTTPKKAVVQKQPPTAPVLSPAPLPVATPVVCPAPVIVHKGPQISMEQAIQEARKRIDQLKLSDKDKRILRDVVDGRLLAQVDYSHASHITINQILANQLIDELINQARNPQFFEPYRVPENIKIPLKLSRGDIEVRQLRSYAQEGSRCGYHAIFNAKAIESLIDHKQPITALNVEREQNKYHHLLGLYGEHMLEERELENFLIDAVDIQYNMHLIAYNNSSNEPWPYTIYEIGDKAVEQNPVGNLAYVFEQIDDRDTTLVHFIMHVGLHWVSASVFKYNDRIIIYYLNSTNAPLREGDRAYTIISKIIDYLLE